MPSSGLSPQHRPLRSALDALRGPGQAWRRFHVIPGFPGPPVYIGRRGPEGVCCASHESRGPPPVLGPTFRVRAFPDYRAQSPRELWVPAPLPRRPSRRLRLFRVRALGSSPGKVPPTLVPRRCIQLSVRRSPAGCHGGHTGGGSCHRASESHEIIPHCRAQPEGCPTQGLAWSARR